MKINLMFRLMALNFVALVIGCTRSNLFDPADNGHFKNPALGPSGEISMSMYVIGGKAGIYQELIIETNGYTRHFDGFRPGGIMIAALPPQEYGELVALFLENDFPHLQERYVSESLADAIYYRLVFRHGGLEHQVEADDPGVPPALRAIITRLSAVAENVRRELLALSLEMSRTTLEHGESVTLTLTATNRQDYTLDLASGGQLYDFFVLPAAAVAPVSSLEVDPAFYLWNWAHDRVFIQVLRNTTLAPGESLTFTISWDGRDRHGEWLEGTFRLGGQLTTVPGGFTALQEVRIVKR